MSKIAPCLWFNAITSVMRYEAGAPFPAGTALMVEFTLAGQRFQALNGGPQYTHSQAMMGIKKLDIDAMRNGC